MTLRSFLMATLTFTMEGSGNRYWFKPPEDLPEDFRFTSVAFNNVKIYNNYQSAFGYVDLADADGGKVVELHNQFFGSSGTSKTYSPSLSASAITTVNNRIANGTFYGFVLRTNLTFSPAPPVSALVVSPSTYTPVPTFAEVLAPADSALATAEAIEPAFVGLTAAPALASAIAGEPSVVGIIEDTYEVNVKATRATLGGSNVTTENVRLYVGDSVTVPIPDASPLLQSERDRHFWIAKLFKGVVTSGVFINVEARGSNWTQRMLTGYTSLMDLPELLLPDGTLNLRIWCEYNGSTNGYYNVQNPAYGTAPNGSYFTLTGIPDNGAYPDAPSALVSASMGDATVSIIDPNANVNASPIAAAATFTSVGVSAGISIVIPVAHADASGQMPRPRMPHYNFNAAPATAEANIEEHRFKSDSQVLADAALADYDALQGASSSAGRNIFVNAAAAKVRGIANDPMEVDPNAFDPYFQYVFGTLPASRYESAWKRFNERSGTVAYNVDTTNRVVSSTSGSTLRGDFQFGVEGPNGRRALRVTNAAIGEIETPKDDTISIHNNGASLEFTIRTTAADGFIGYRSSLAGFRPKVPTTRYWIEDGYLNMVVNNTGDGRASIRSAKRINDGEWHHIVITNMHGNHPRMVFGYNVPAEIWIDGKLDRRGPNSTGYVGGDDARAMQMPRYMFGAFGDIPALQADISDLIFREVSLKPHDISQLYYRMMGIAPVYAGAPTTALAESLDAEVDSGMKRILIISFNIETNQYNAELGPNANRMDFWTKPGQLVSGGGYDRKGPTFVNRMLVTYQSALHARHYDLQKQGHYAVTPKGSSISNPYGYFYDDITGAQRYINLQEDIDNLDDFDIIYIQNYPNPVYHNQEQRQRTEAFLASVRQAVVDGHKLWINNGPLAADLGLISDIEYVPTMAKPFYLHTGDMNPSQSTEFGTEADIRSALLINGPSWASYKDTSAGNSTNLDADITREQAKGLDLKNDDIPTKPGVLPADDASDVAWHQAGGMSWTHGRGWDPEPTYNADTHRNNMWRVVNEVPGLTNLPGWEINEYAWRYRTTMFPKDNEWPQSRVALENRTGEPDLLGRRDPKGTGLKVGDIFYDAKMTTNYPIYWEFIDQNDRSGDMALLNGRVVGTWAVPPGHLRVGRAITTFGPWHWRKNRKTENPYKDFIRNAAVMPGDLWDGQTVKGYVYMDFAEHPSRIGLGLTGQGMGRQLFPAIDSPENGAERPDNSPVPKEDEWSVKFDWSSHRMVYGGGGMTNSQDSVGIITGSDGKQTIGVISGGGAMPIAQDINEYYRVQQVPLLTWNGRGLIWLMNADKVTTDYTSVLGRTSTANAGMKDAQVSVEFDREVSVRPAQANANIVAPAQALVREVKVFAGAATATVEARPLQAGYKAEAATATATMPENVRRDPDIEEVIWLTMTYSLNTIYLRMEEN